MMLDLFEGDVQNLIKQDLKLEEKFEIASGMLTALASLPEEICHQDIKPANFLYKGMGIHSKLSSLILDSQPDFVNKLIWSMTTKPEDRISAEQAQTQFSNLNFGFISLIIREDFSEIPGFFAEGNGPWPFSR